MQYNRTIYSDEGHGVSVKTNTLVNTTCEMVGELKKQLLQLTTVNSPLKWHRNTISNVLLAYITLTKCHRTDSEAF